MNWYKKAENILFPTEQEIGKIEKDLWSQHIWDNPKNHELAPEHLTGIHPIFNPKNPAAKKIMPFLLQSQLFKRFNDPESEKQAETFGYTYGAASLEEARQVISDIKRFIDYGGNTYPNFKFLRDYVIDKFYSYLSDQNEFNWSPEEIKFMKHIIEIFNIKK